MTIQIRIHHSVKPTHLIGCSSWKTNDFNEIHLVRLVCGSGMLLLSRWVNDDGNFIQTFYPSEREYFV